MINAFAGVHQMRSAAQTNNNEKYIDIDMEADLIVQSVLQAEQGVMSQGTSVGTDDEETDDRKPAARPSPDSLLPPILCELAQVVAHCSVGTKPTLTGKSANVPAKNIRQRIYAVGSPELREYWDQVVAMKSFSRAGYRSCIRSTQ